MEPLRVLTFGAGAIGTYVGGSLALAGNRVVFIERAEVAEGLNRRGLQLDLRFDDRRRSSSPQVVARSFFTVVDSLAKAIERGPFDVSIFALKSFDTKAARDAMEPYADQLPPVLCLSNGVDNESALAAALGPGKVIAGTVSSSIGRGDVGAIVLERLRGVGVACPEQILGTSGGRGWIARLIEALNRAYLNARLFPEAAAMKWSKLLTNLVGNATSAILDMTPAEIFTHPGLFALEMRMLCEALAVMKAQKIKVVDLPGTPVRALAFASRLNPRLSRPLLSRAIGGGRGAKMPSFHIDLHSGRERSEVDWLNGAVVRYGRVHGVLTPVNQVLNETLLALTRRKIPFDQFSHQPGRLLDLVDER